MPRTSEPNASATPLIPAAPQKGLGVETTVRIQDLTEPARMAALRELIWRNKLVVLTGQEFTNEEWIAFGHRLGRIRPYFQENYHHPDHPEIFVSTNVPEDGRKIGVAGTGRMWHSDYSMFDDPLSYTMITPKILPRGNRKTYFIDMERVLDELPTDMRETLAGREAFHEATWYYKIQPKDVDRPIIELVREFRELSPGAWHPAIIEHPVTGAKMLYVSSGFTTKLSGMTHEEHGEFLKRLFAFVEDERFIHAQDWRIGDILIWDNRTFIHHASTVSTGEPTRSYRISLNDGRPFYVGHDTGYELPS